LKRDSTKPFVSLGNDINKHNDRIVGSKRKKTTEDGTASQDKVLLSPSAALARDLEDKPEGSGKEDPSAAAVSSIPHQEIFCGCIEHMENKVMEVLIPANVATVFEMLYHPTSAFMTKYNQKRGAKDFEEEVHETTKVKEKDDHWKKRTLRYSLYFKNPLSKHTTLLLPPRLPAPYKFLPSSSSAVVQTRIRTLCALKTNTFTRLRKMAST